MDENESPATEVAPAPSVGFAELQKNLRDVSAERDRLAAELRDVTRALAAERDRHLTELGEITRSLGAERDRLAAELSETRRSLADATARAAANEEQAVQLRRLIEASPKSDPALLLWELLSQKTQAGVAWVRAKIPENHPALPWFDRTIETAAAVGRFAVSASIAFARWAWPSTKTAALKLVKEVEARFAKK